MVHLLDQLQCSLHVPIDGEDGDQAEGTQITDEGTEAVRVAESIDRGWGAAQPVLPGRVGFEGGTFVDEDGGPRASQK